MIRKFIKIINYFFQSILIYILFLLGRLLGIKLSRKVFAYLFLLVGPFFKSTKIIKKNLKIFSSNNVHFNENEIINYLWKSYGMTFIEYIFLDYLNKGTKHIKIEDEANLDLIINGKKPVIFVSGHFSNFELMSMEITKKNIPLATIYRPLNNLFLNPFMEYLRKKYICKNQIQKGIKGVKDTIEFINNNTSIALMIDQRVSEGEKINFFKKPAFTTTLPAQLSKKFNMDIIPVYIERNSDNSFKIEFQKRIKPEEFQNKFALTEKMNQILEEMIKRNPKQWIWTHDRWK